MAGPSTRPDGVSRAKWPVPNEDDDCVLLVGPALPGRRWCSPQHCGNRVRVARHCERWTRIRTASL
ncbi:CGNR zinc finger domain-containing protein [Nocardia sp. NBC_00508]|uniref:CGNR zinc finger domain-containing protein n=1 Tax=Nocardia sp. NBC_00508 TaxID=2975992 RepID=UPI002E80CDB0|nr:CGNR zinc finger domain-containing protein [Nocardia sp. NBC_00508]